MPAEENLPQIGELIPSGDLIGVNLNGPELTTGIGSLGITAIDPKKWRSAIVLTNSQGETTVKIDYDGHFEVQDEKIKELLAKNPQAMNAMRTIMDCVKDDMLAKTLEEALNCFFVGLINEFHKDIYERVRASTGRL